MRINFYNRIVQYLIHNHSTFLFFIFVGLFIAAKPYLAVKVYPNN